MTHIVILIRHARLPAPHIPPPLPVILAPVQRQRRRQQQRQPVPDRAREQLRVHVQRQRRVPILRVRRQSRYPVVFLRVERGYGEGVGEEVRVAHDGIGGVERIGLMEVFVFSPALGIFRAWEFYRVSKLGVVGGNLVFRGSNAAHPRHKIDISPSPSPIFRLRSSVNLTQLPLLLNLS